jgi:hypothetical protein
VKRALTGLVAAVCVSLTGSLASAAGVYPTGQIGLDVSWPNCGVKLPKVAFGIVGVTGGTAYSTNKCLAQQAAIFGSKLSLYVNTGWNDQSPHINANAPRQCAPADQVCVAYNYGFNSGWQAFDTAVAAKAFSGGKWWLDVETMNSWNDDVNQNRASIQGTYDALKARGVGMIGVYSTAYQWDVITAGWQTGWPNWVATGTATAFQAKRFCVGNDFTGGPTWLVQYIPRRPHLDHDLAC